MTNAEKTPWIMDRRFAGLVLAPFLAVGMAVAAPAALAADYTSELTASADEGLPEGHSEEAWLAAEGSATATAEGDEHVVTLEAANLVADGLYTVWWVNPGIIGMSMGPGGGVPDNEFRADDEGKAQATLRVPADNDYEMIVVVYHADDQTHGEEPGEMGEITFKHLEGSWPGSAGEGDM